MKTAARSYTIHRLPACTDWQGNSYPDRYGVTLTLRGNPMKVDGGEYATRDEAIAAGEAACGLASRCDHDNAEDEGECFAGLCTCENAHLRAQLRNAALNNQPAA